MSAELITLEYDGPIAVMSNNRPEKHNAANDAMDTRLWACLAELHQRDGLRAVVWRGNGKSFSSGRDTTELGVRTEDISNFDFIERGHAGARQFFTLPCPIIVALKGWVIGGSFERALLCDLRIAGESAKMMLPELRHGVVPDSGGTARLFQMAGHGLVADLALTGRPMDAQEALRHGVVSRVVPDAELDATALEIARTIAGNAAFSVKMFRRTLGRMGDPLVLRSLPEESAAQSLVFASDDYAELKAARAESREPKFRGPLMQEQARELDTGTPQLLCRVEQRVAVITLNRPEARNALSMELKQALHRLLARLESDPGIGCLLLTGAGGAFCAGGDTKVMSRDGRPPSPDDRKRQLRWEHEIPRRLHTMGTPVICALPGAAAGAGFSLALSCDLRIAASSAFVLTSFAKLGLSGDYGGTWFLSRLVGTAKAREIYFTAERISAQECEKLGIVNRVVPDAELERESFELARRIAAGPPIAYRYMKENLNRALEHDLQTCLDHEAERMVRGAMTEDYQEAVAAFGEKRPPVFRGR